MDNLPIQSEVLCPGIFFKRERERDYHDNLHVFCRMCDELVHWGG